jgi:outer membrane protein assembly factor BamB
MALATLATLLALSGCSGRTTGPTDVALDGAGKRKARLTAVGSCDQSCTAFMRWRRVGDSAWTEGPRFDVGRVTNAPWGQTATGLTAGVAYEYQACGKESSMSAFVCVGPNGKVGTTHKFVAQSAGWGQFHHDPSLSGHNPLEITLSPGNVGSLTRAWSANIPGTGAVVGSPAVADGVVYTTVSPAQGSAYLAAFPAFCATGGASCDPLWRGPIATPAASATPAVLDDVVYVGGGSTLYAFSASGCWSATCAPLWTGTTAGPIVSSPTTFNGLVYVGTGGTDKSLYTFERRGCGAATCSPDSRRPTFGAVSTAAVGNVGRGNAVIVGAARHAYGFFENGSLAWTRATDGTITAPVVSIQGMLHIGSADGTLHSLTLDTGTLQWTGPTGGAIRAAPAYAEGVVHVGSDDGKLYAFPYLCATNGISCTPSWTGATGGPVRSAPAVANGVVYAGSADGRLYAFAAGGCGSPTCTPLASPRPGSGVDPTSAPAVAGGVVYVSGGGSLHAYTLP